MNKRIQELADQAGLQPYYDAQKEQISKFAKLIVKECVSLMDTEKNFCDNPGTYESDEYYIHMKAKAEAFESASRIIEYHFGGEE